MLAINVSIPNPTIAKHYAVSTVATLLTQCNVEQLAFTATATFSYQLMSVGIWYIS